MNAIEEKMREVEEYHGDAVFSELGRFLSEEQVHTLAERMCEWRLGIDTENGETPDHTTGKTWGDVVRLCEDYDFNEVMFEQALGYLPWEQALNIIDAMLDDLRFRQEEDRDREKEREDYKEAQWRDCLR